MTNQIKNISVLGLMFFSFALMAKENITYPGISSISYTKVASGCEPSKSKTDLDVKSKQYSTKDLNNP